MKKFLIYLFSILVFASLAYNFRIEILKYANPDKENLLNKANTEILSYFKSCSRPIKYSIGNFDSRFNVSREYLLSALTDAEAIWEKPFGKELFSHVPDSNNLKINLSFDTRQLVTAQLGKFDEVTQQDKSYYDSLKEKLSSVEASVLIEKSNYENRLSDYNTKQNEYNTEVEYWNKKGGASESEYQILELKKFRLNTEANELNLLQKEVKEKVDEFNNLVLDINKLASTINTSSDEYNKLSATRGEVFQEGVYKSSGIKKEINIYEFDSREKLVRLLAHELGHALGIEHVTDKESIMYELNQGKSMTLSADDLSALKKVCDI